MDGRVLRDGRRRSAVRRLGTGCAVVGLAICGGLAAGCGGLAAGAQATTRLVEPTTPLLPERFGDWTRQGEPTPQPAVLNDGTANAVMHEDGLLRAAAASYGEAGHAGAVMAQAMQFGDATGAVAAYTYFHRREMRDAATEGGARNHTNIARGQGRTLLREGTTLVLLDGAGTPGGAGAPGEAGARALAAVLPKVGGPQGLPPLLPTLLPGKGLVAGSAEYAVGPAGYAAEGGVLPADLLGFAKAGEVATAEYAGQGGRPGKLTLVLLPTPELAGQSGRALEGWLNSEAGRAAGLGTVKLRRVGPLLALATGGLSADAAKELVDSVSLRQEVTWNKPVPPEFHAEVRKTASLLTSIIVFSGVVGLAAILLGLFLGFGRAWVRVLLGKPAATEPEFLRLDLRDRSGRGEAPGPGEGLSPGDRTAG